MYRMIDIKNPMLLRLLADHTTATVDWINHTPGNSDWKLIAAARFRWMETQDKLVRFLNRLTEEEGQHELW